MTRGRRGPRRVSAGAGSGESEPIDRQALKQSLSYLFATPGILGFGYHWPLSDTEASAMTDAILRVNATGAGIPEPIRAGARLFGNTILPYVELLAVVFFTMRTRIVATQQLAAQAVADAQAQTSRAGIGTAAPAAAPPAGGTPAPPMQAAETVEMGTARTADVPGISPEAFAREMAERQNMLARAAGATP